jgi:3',5'-cyclic AMP phosphodiesterase CpdA
MKLISEPNITVKMRRMRERVRWQHAELQQRGIDQTRLVLENEPQDLGQFSFLVLGDSGTGRHRSSSPQRQVAEQLMKHQQGAEFILHTGDVVYLVGSSEQYRENFIKPYQEWLVGDDYHHIAYDKMVFKLPFLPVLGNHDYYDLPPLLGLVAGITGPLRYALRSYVDIDVSWHGSYQGDAFARAFIDYLKGVSGFRLAQHLDQHYQGYLDGTRCLSYRPKQYTRVPNRYYQFRYGGIDFFALDSNTFNQPLPLSVTDEDRPSREALQEQRQQLEDQKANLLRQAGELTMNPLDEDGREEITEELEQIDEQIYDIDKQLDGNTLPVVDTEQLNWLQDRLIASWQNPDVRGRILFFHHPPYVTEATKWCQGQTLAVRHHLRQVLDAVAAEVGDIARGAPLVNLVLNGHAHCMEYLKTEDTGHGDSHIPFLICGGSGYSLRRQREEGPHLKEFLYGEDRTVATSHLYVGRTGKGSTLKRPYSGLRVDINSGEPLSISLTPLIAEKFDGKWTPYAMESIQV